MWKLWRFNRNVVRLSISFKRLASLANKIVNISRRIDKIAKFNYTKAG